MSPEIFSTNKISARIWRVRSVKASSSLKLLSLFVFWNYRYIFQSSSYKMFIFIYVLPSFTLSTVMFQVKLSTALLSLRPFSPSFSPSRERSSWKSIPVKHESRSIIEAEQLGNRQIKFRWNIAVKRMDDFPQLSQLQLHVCCRLKTRLTCLRKSKSTDT